MSDNTHEIALVTNDFLLDDLDDLPSFSVFPTGAYNVRLVEGIVEKDIKMKEVDTPCFEVAMTINEVIELGETLGEGEAAPKPGDVSSVLWNRTHKMAMGAFKEFAKPIAKRFNCGTVGEVIAASKGLDMLIIVKRTYDKTNDRHNMRIKKLDVV